MTTKQKRIAFTLGVTGYFLGILALRLLVSPVFIFLYPLTALCILIYLVSTIVFES